MCCGNDRKYAAGVSEVYPGTVRVNYSVLRAARFRYTGQTRMSAIGEGTRSVYCFDGPGATAIVDGRDVASMARIPVLARV